MFRAEGPSSGSRFLRALLAAALVAIALAAAGALVWPGWRARLTGGAPAPAAPPPAPAAPAPATAPAGPGPTGAAPSGKAYSDPAILAPKAAPAEAHASATPRPAPAPAKAGAANASAPRARPRAPRAVEADLPEAPLEDLAAVPRVREPPRLAAADRQLLYLISQKRGEAAPAEPVERTDLDGASTLDPAAVERVMDESQGAFSACVSRSMKAGEPGEEVRRATLRLTVDRAGSVAAAAISEREVGRTVLGRCLVSAARRLAFPAFEGGRVEVAVPLVLQAPR